VTSRPAEQLGEPASSAVPDGGLQPIGAAGELPDLPAAPQTGDDLVDAAVQRLSEVAAQPLEDQLAVYEAVHRTLQDRLADVEG
jgi:hypothetical protein